MPPAALISAMANWAASSKLAMALVLSPLISHSPRIFTGADSLSVDAVVAVEPPVVAPVELPVVVAVEPLVVVAAAAAVVPAVVADVAAVSSSSSPHAVATTAKAATGMTSFCQSFIVPLQCTQPLAACTRAQP